MTDYAQRIIDRVEDKIHVGGDSQVDDRNVIITPMTPMLTDPFLLLGEDWFSTNGFQWHPHRGLETVTLVLDGVLEHGDSLGNSGALTAGDIQWMTAGRGIIHRELAFRNERAHILQLWVNLPGELKMVGTRYQDLRATTRPSIERDGVRIDLVSGSVDGTSGPALNNWPISGSIITLEPNRSHDHVLPGHDRAFFYVLSGEVIVGGRLVRAGQVAWSEPLLQTAASRITVATGDGDEPSVVMAYSGQPIGQPVVMGGPFVMNSGAEITQAFNDYQAGKFGSIPRQGRLQRL
ncbi:MAG TPA: pirin family protein [Thermoanaerobaculia bacterium]